MNIYRNIEPYIGQMLIQIKDVLSYRSDFIMQIFMRLGFPAISIAAWVAIFYSTNSATIGGLSLMNMIEYYLVASVVYLIIWYNSAVWAMQWLVQTGEISSILIRPASFPLTVFIDSLAGVLPYFALIGVPILVIVMWLFNAQIGLAVLATFAMYMVIAFFIAFFASFVLGCLAIYFIDVSGLAMGYAWIQFWLAGAVVPLSLFPSAISSVLIALPWAYQVYIPVSLLTGKISVASALNSMWIGVAWVLITFAVAFVMWHFTKRYMDVAGV